MFFSGCDRIFDKIIKITKIIPQGRFAVSAFILGLVLSVLTASFTVGILGFSQPTLAQPIDQGNAWRVVYQRIPDFPRENQYTSRETGKKAENNTLASRLVRYHIFIKQRAPNFRLDWKLTLADYLGANEPMSDSTYPGRDQLRQNPFEGDIAAIKKLTRQQRNNLVQVLTDAFTPSAETVNQLEGSRE